jgi:hypothetical protein
MWNRTHPLSRRDLLRQTGLGFGSLALAGLLDADRARAAAALGEERAGLNLRPKEPHFKPRARAVIQLMQNGGPSQMDLFDPKPELQKRHGQKHVEEVETLQKGSESMELMGSPFEFFRAGQCGMDFSTPVRSISSIADEITMIRSMHTEHNNHSEALIMFQTGKIFSGRPTTGAWISYALGTENQNLPAYIVLRDPEGYNTNGALNWDNGWLPALYRGTEFASKGDPVLNLQPKSPLPSNSQEDRLDLLAKLNERHRLAHPDDTSLEARIRNYELAAHMQLAAGDALDLSKESSATKKMYGLEDPVTAGYGLRCLMARRLVEQGVRFVQVFPPLKPSFQPWDNHSDLEEGVTSIAGATDLPSAALVKDLKARGLLDEVIVMWAGEFGRLPVSQKGTGRDHNRNAFSLWMAGGGFKAGYTHGATDELGYRAVEGKVSVPDLHATMLHALGLDHQRLVFQHHGREESLTDVALTGARVNKDLLS